LPTAAVVVCGAEVRWPQVLTLSPSDANAAVAGVATHLTIAAVIIALTII
jgi:hypothetical protein